MKRQTSHSKKRSRKKAARKALRAKKSKPTKKKPRHAKKAGSIAIHSRLPGLEGTELGAMDVVIDTRRQESHPALITIAIHQREQKRSIVWSIETGFGGMAPRAGYQEIPDGPIDQITPTEWVFDTAQPATA